MNITPTDICQFGQAPMLQTLGGTSITRINSDYFCSKTHSLIYYDKGHKGGCCFSFAEISEYVFVY